MKILISEDIHNLERLGFHCSRHEYKSTFSGTLKDEYVQRFFRTIIDLYKANEDKWRQLLEGIKENNDFFEEEEESENILNLAEDYDTGIVTDEHAELYAPYFGQTQLNFIFTFDAYAEKSYGEYCYEVFINNQNYEHAHDNAELLADVFFFFDDKSKIILNKIKQ